MPPVPINLRPFLSGMSAAAALLLSAPVQADQTLGNDPFAGKDPGFFHRASNDVGNFFKRLFATEEEKRRSQPAPSPHRSRSGSQRYNLDQPPAELRSTPSRVTPSPSGTATLENPTASNTKSKPQARSSSRDSALIEEPPRSKPKPQKSPSSDSSGPVVSSETTTRPKTRKQTGSADTGTVLYSNTGTADARQPEPPPGKQAEAPPPKAPSETPSVLTGSKTGKAGRVKSPYPPYSELDVTGLPSGSLALDPTTQKVFRIP